MAIAVKKEVNRLPGFTPKTGVSIVAGYPVVYDPTVAAGTTIMVYTGAASMQVIGFASETTTPFTAAGTGLPGVSGDYPNYDRGGLVGVFVGNGGVFDFFDDGRGSPLVTTDTFTLNYPVVVTFGGLLGMSTTVTVPVTVGVVTAVTGAAASLKVTIKTLI